MGTFPKEPVYIRSYRDRVVAAQERTQIAMSCGTVELHANDSRRSAPGDPMKLRGIPVTGVKGVGGTMPGTRPDSIR